ncbi:hypothetical protein ADS46_10945 [Halomonas sp. G11]|nr:hypothetical protein ADS46_10945 [Halomonas sp. G11]
MKFTFFFYSFIMLYITISKYLSRMSSRNCIWRYIIYYATSCLYNCTFTNCYASKYNYPTTKPDAISDFNIFIYVSIIIWDRFTTVKIMVLRNK